MKRILGVIILVFSLVAVAACSGEQPASEKKPVPVAAQKVAPDGQMSRAAGIFRTISSQEAKALIDTRKDLMLVDLRESKELREGYIAGSQMIPMSAIAKGTTSLPADKALLLICAVGGRSYAVGRYFAGKGYPEIYNLKGGISAWKQAGLPLHY